MRKFTKAAIISAMIGASSIMGSMPAMLNNLMSPRGWIRENKVPRHRKHKRMKTNRRTYSYVSQYDNTHAYFRCRQNRMLVVKPFAISYRKKRKAVLP